MNSCLKALALWALLSAAQGEQRPRGVVGLAVAPFPAAGAGVASGGPHYVQAGGPAGVSAAVPAVGALIPNKYPYFHADVPVFTAPAPAVVAKAASFAAIPTGFVSHQGYLGHVGAPYAAPAYGHPAAPHGGYGYLGGAHGYHAAPHAYHGYPAAPQGYLAPSAGYLAGPHSAHGYAGVAATAARVPSGLGYYG